LDTYIIVFVGALALATVICFDPTMRTKVRQMWQHHVPDQGEFDVEPLDFVLPGSSDLAAPAAKRRKKRKR
jgi:hypothetical protein